MQNAPRFLYTKTLFILSLFVIPVTATGVYFLDFGDRRSLFQDAILSLSILLAILFAFLFIGLYRGIKLKDNIGQLTDNLRSPDVLNHVSFGEMDGFDMGDGCLGMIVSIVLWIVAFIIALLLLWFLSFVLWAMMLWFVAILYWIFYRALRLVFRHSPKCHGNLLRSLQYAAFFSLLYTGWLYGLLLLIHRM